MIQARLCFELFKLIIEGLFYLAAWSLKTISKALKNGRIQQ
jgi:hypothetical protein